MTVIRDILIKNFRGIRELRWMPGEGINCLIGHGDAGKSTILDAIEYTVGARRQINFTDADFHRCNIDDPIEIFVTLGALSRDLLNLETYGHFTRGFDKTTGAYENETRADLETVLTVRLIVRDDLEAEWGLYSEGAAAEGRERNLIWKHRQAIAPTRLGTSASHHMALGQRSILNKLSSDSAQASKALAAAARQARKAFADEGCEGVDDVLATSQRVASEMGIPVQELHALLDVRGVSFSGGTIALHDEEHVPLKGLGSGSLRLLVAGLQKSAGKSNISIIDEVEFGLEPYRIVRLLDALGAKGNDKTQQVFMTTHSPIVLRELSSPQLYAIRASRINMPIVDEENPQYSVVNTVHPLGDSEENQKTLRACAEAFLAPTVIVCEGKTEIGLIRGLDLFCQDQGNRSIVSHGCHWTDGGGSSMYQRAITFGNMGYRTALLMDSDVLPDAQIVTQLAAANVSVFRWPDGKTTEDVIFSSAPASCITDLLDIAVEWKSEDSVNAKIQSESTNAYDLAACRTEFQEGMRPILAACAGQKKWYKDIEPAERLMREILGKNWLDLGDDIKVPMNELWQWVKASPTVQAEKPQPAGEG